MSNVFALSEFLSKAVAGVRPGALIWSPYHPHEAIHRQGDRLAGPGLVYKQFGLAHWNIAYSTIPALQVLTPQPVASAELFHGYFLLQHIIKQDLGGLPVEDLAGCQTLRQFVSLAEQHTADLDRWARSEGWPSGFEPHGWVQHLKRLT